VKGWRAAIEAWEAIARPYEAAVCGWRATEAALSHGDRATARDHGQAALETAARLGSRWLVEELHGLARRGRVSFDAEAAPETSVGDAMPDDPFGLTAREREVLQLIAAGATNREIGQSLFMAEKTASVHVSRILAKLGVRSRTEAAAVAHRSGLSPADLAAGSPR
jgi:DNA-binding NarL/FixJ family response regulator